MDFDHYEDDSVAIALDLINHYGTAPRMAAGAHDTPLPDLGGFLEEWQLSSAGVRTGDEAAAQQLADRLHAVFTTHDAGDAAATINAVLADRGAVPHLTEHDDAGWHLHYQPAGVGPIDRLAVIAAMGLATVVRTSGIRRLGRCDATACRDVYVDTSRNNRRRFCGETCANRSHVAAHRARQRADEHTA